MKNTRLRKNLLATLLTFVMVFTLIPSDMFGTYVASAATSNTSALYYNTGHRDEAATELSDAAKAYYDGFAYDYANGVSLTGSDLKAVLGTKMSGTLTNKVTYSSLPTYWDYTDAEDGKAGTIYFYSDENENSFSGSLNREHVWPKSHASFYETNGGADLHHLRPAVSTVNSARSSYVMAEFNETSSQAVKCNGKVVGYLSGDSFEPLPNVKGDVARIFLYVYTCWNQPNLFENVPAAKLPAFDADDSKNDGLKVIESLETLLKWNYDDPVDTWEMSQNDLCEIVQGNRNVFIDYPEYAWLIFGLEVPEGIASPASGNAVPGTYEPGDLSEYYGEDSKIDESQKISIAEAKTKADDTIVVVEGQVTYLFGDYGTPSSAILTDASGESVQYYFKESFKHNIGDVILVKGTVGSYHGAKQINIIADKLVTKASEAPAITFEEATLADILANVNAYDYKLVALKNVVLGEKTNYDASGSRKNLAITQNGTTMTVFCPAAYPSGVAKTDTVNINAVVVLRDGTAILRTGSSSDYTLVSKGEGVNLTTEEGILAAIAELEADQSLGQEVTLTGKITNIKTAYSAQYNNISVNIQIGDTNLLCYRLAGGATLKVGDVIKVTGDVTNYMGNTPEFVAGSTYVLISADATETPVPVVTETPAVSPVATETPAPTSIVTAGSYKKITTLDELGEGGQIVFYGISGSYEFAMGNTLSSKKVAAVSVDIENDTITNPADEIIWTVEKQADGTYTLYNAAAGKYLVISVNNTAGFTLENTATFGYTVSVQDGNFFFQTTMSGNSRGISIYQNDFRAYAKSSAKTLNLYKLTEVVPPVTATPVPTATATPVPATATPVPTATETPVPTGSTLILPAEFVEGGKYEKISTLEEIGEGGQFVFYGICDAVSAALGNTVKDKKGAAVNVEFVDGAIVDPSADIVWTLTKQADGTYSLYNAAINKYLFIASDKTTSYVLGDEPSYFFNISVEDADFVVETTLSTNAGRAVSIYSSGDFRAYQPGTQYMNTLNLYKRVEPEYEYQLIDSVDELDAEGKYILFGVNGDYQYAMNNVLTKGKMGVAAVEFTEDGSIARDADESIVWVIKREADGRYSIYNEAAGKYVKVAGTSNTSLGLDTAAFLFDISFVDGTVRFASDLEERGICIYQNDFRSYKPAIFDQFAYANYLYKLSEKKTSVVTPTPVPTATSTPVPTATSTPVPTATSTPVPTATSTPVPTATNTPVPTATNTPVPTATNTPVPTATSTPLPTQFVEPAAFVEGGIYKQINSIDELGEGGQFVFYGISNLGSAYAMGNTLSSSRPNGNAVELVDVDGVSTVATPDASVIWTLTKQADGSFTLYNAALKKYLVLDKDSTKPFTLTDEPTYGYTVSADDNGDFDFLTTMDGCNRIISIYEKDFRAYIQGSKDDVHTLTLYKYFEEQPVVEEPKLDITFKVVSAWNDYVQAEISITNISDELIKSWKANVFTNGKIEQIWNAELVSTIDGGYVIGCPSWKQNLNVGESYSFGIIAKKTADVFDLGPAELITSEKETAEANYKVSFNKTGAWSYGFNGEIVIENLGNENIVNWTVEFDYDDEITNIWNAVIVSHVGNHYVITNAGWNAIISAGGRISFGFSGRPAVGEFSAADIKNVKMVAVQ